MKITLSSNLINTVLSQAVATTTLLVSAMQENNLLKPNEEAKKESKYNFINNLPTYSSIKEVTSPVLSIKKSDNNLILDFNEEYLLRLSGECFSYLGKLTSPTCKSVSLGNSFIKNIKDICDEFVPKPVKQSVIEVKPETTHFDIVGAAIESFDSVVAKEVKDLDVTTLTENKVLIRERKVIRYCHNLLKNFELNELTVLRVGESLPYELDTVDVFDIVNKKDQVTVFEYELLLKRWPKDVLDSVRKYYGLNDFYLETIE